MPIDPRLYSVHAHATPFPGASSFHDDMAEQLRHAPWLLLSVAVHAIAVLIVLMIPSTPPPAEQKVVTMLPAKAPEEIEKPPEPEEKPVEHDPVDEPQLQDDVIVEDETTDEAFTDDLTEVASALDSDSWSTELGLGGGAAGKFSGRGTGRGQLRARSGRDVAVSIEHGLEWLQRHQDDDGKWDADDFMKHDGVGALCDGTGNPVHDVGVTGLALLAFLGDGSTMNVGPYRDVVRKAVHWLRKQQDPGTGLFGTAASSHFVYDHVIASLAITEACGLSRSRLLRSYAQKGLGYLEAHRNPYGVWRYQPRDNQSDTSVTGWAVLAYKSAQDFGFDVDAQALQASELWLDQVTDPLTGRAGYTARGQRSSRHEGDHGARFPPERGEGLAAVGLMARFFLGQDPAETPVMLRAADTILSSPPVWDEDGGAIDHYYWYYATYALYQMGKDHWRRWSKHLGPAVVRTQRDDGNFEGSWDPVGVWGEEGGRVYSTAILVLTLEAYYRYTRVFVR